MVYLMQCEDFVKIGRSKHPSKRLQDIQVSNPFKVKLLAVVNSENDKELESELHIKYNHLKQNGEWFSFNKDVFDSLVSSYGFTVFMDFKDSSSVDYINHVSFKDMLNSEYQNARDIERLIYEQKLEDIKSELVVNVRNNTIESIKDALDTFKATNN